MGPLASVASRFQCQAVRGCEERLVLPYPMKEWSCRMYPVIYSLRLR